MSKSNDESNVRLMVMPSEGGEAVMIFPVPQHALAGRRSIQWTPDAKAILYKDASQGLWHQSLNEERPQPVRGFEELSLRKIAWSFDGKRLAYTTGTTSQEIILMENLK